MMTDAEFARRLPVWSALSDLFLDTEPDEATYRHIVRVCDEAGYDTLQVEQIFFDEVGPVFFVNLLSVAGEWQSWPADFVEERMRRWMSRERRPSWVFRVLTGRTLREIWQGLQTHLSVSDSLPDGLS